MIQINTGPLQPCKKNTHVNSTNTHNVLPPRPRTFTRSKRQTSILADYDVSFSYSLKPRSQLTLHSINTFTVFTGLSISVWYAAELHHLLVVGQISQGQALQGYTWVIRGDATRYLVELQVFWTNLTSIINTLIWKSPLIFPKPIILRCMTALLCVNFFTF